VELHSLPTVTLPTSPSLCLSQLLVPTNLPTTPSWLHWNSQLCPPWEVPLISPETSQPLSCQHLLSFLEVSTSNLPTRSTAPPLTSSKRMPPFSVSTLARPLPMPRVVLDHPPAAEADQAPLAELLPPHTVSTRQLLVSLLLEVSYKCCCRSSGKSAFSSFSIH